MESATELGNLIARYAELIDAGDFDGVARLLDGASVGGAGNGPLLSGHDAIRRLFASTARLYPDGTPGTKHVTTNFDPRDRRRRRSRESPARTGRCSRRSKVLRSNRSWQGGTTTGSSDATGSGASPNANTWWTWSVT